MPYADLRMFMDDLKKLIHGNHHPFINNNPLILSKRPQFQLLYQELDSIIQTLFSIHHLHELEKVRNLKKGFKDATEEAQDTIDLFLFALHFTNSGVSPRYDVLKTSLDLNKILKSINCIKMELKTINISNMKMDSSSRIGHIKTQSVAGGTSYTINPLGIKKASKEIALGLDHDVEIIRHKLTEDTKQLCVVSIVGMGGIGKTTLATKLFNDPFLKYHFHHLYSDYGKLENFYPLPLPLPLLRVLDLQKSMHSHLPLGLESLIHLRYLAIWTSFKFPSSICKLISLQTLIAKMSFVDEVCLPGKISNLVNLRQLWSNRRLILPAIEKSMNLQSISNVRSVHGADNIGRSFPNIKKLEYTFASGEERHFEHLPYLENLILSLRRRSVSPIHQESLLNRIWFPASMKKLTLVGCGLPWSDMSFIHTLPNLEVLKLMSNAFEGSQWDAREQQFQQLKFLKLERLDIKQWEASDTSFPCLRRLTLRSCYNLEGVPFEIGDILTLELIETNKGIASGVMESMKRILKEQRDEGNTLLKIIVGEMELSEHEDSESKQE